MTTRKSISLTKPNDEWLAAQVASQEYISKSDALNDLIRHAREVDLLRKKLIKAEQGGFSDQTPAEMLKKFKDEVHQ